MAPILCYFFKELQSEEATFSELLKFQGGMSPNPIEPLVTGVPTMNSGSQNGLTLRHRSEGWLSQSHLQLPSAKDG